MQNVREEFTFLNRLRESGTVNMFGASPYVEEEFDVDRNTAKEIVGEWMRWISENPSRVDL